MTKYRIRVGYIWVTEKEFDFSSSAICWAELQIWLNGIEYEVVPVRGKENN